MVKKHWWWPWELSVLYHTCVAAVSLSATIPASFFTNLPYSCTSDSPNQTPNVTSQTITPCIPATRALNQPLTHRDHTPPTITPQSLYSQVQRQNGRSWYCLDSWPRRWDLRTDAACNSPLHAPAAWKGSPHDMGMCLHIDLTPSVPWRRHWGDEQHSPSTRAPNTLRLLSYKTPPQMMTGELIAIFSWCEDTGIK